MAAVEGHYNTFTDVEHFAMAMVGFQSLTANHVLKMIFLFFSSSRSVFGYQFYCTRILHIILCIKRAAVFPIWRTGLYQILFFKENETV